MSRLGTRQNPLRVAVVGSGPSGFYAAEAILNGDIVASVDMIERLPAPYGLVRYGVAPDHPKLKQAIQVYDTIAQHDRFKFFGNLTVGSDITVHELRRCYHAVIFACGAETDRHLGIPGEDLPGSHTATEFVGWYNGHPDYRDRTFDLASEAAVIIGHGNVAADVCRILAQPVSHLQTTDMAQHALDALKKSKIRDIIVVGRRGPAQAKFTARELKELGTLPNCEVVVDPASVELNAESQKEIEGKTNAGHAKTYKVFQTFSERASSAAGRRIFFRFCESPVRLTGDRKVDGIVLEKNELVGKAFQQKPKGTGRLTKIPCGLVFRSIGYKGQPIPEIPFDDEKGIIPNTDGRIRIAIGHVHGLYVVGWIKRGATGIIGTNRADAVATVESLWQDLPELDNQPKGGALQLQELASRKGIDVISYADWKRIDSREIARGESKGKPREKFTRVSEMLKAAITDDAVLAK